jgi:hypothetical protein
MGTTGGLTSGLTRGGGAGPVPDTSSATGPAIGGGGVNTGSLANVVGVDLEEKPVGCDLF